MIRIGPKTKIIIIIVIICLTCLSAGTTSWLIKQTINKNHESMCPETAPISLIRDESEEITYYSFLDKLPYEEKDFKIDYPEFNIYTVYIETEEAKNKACQWFVSQGADMSKLKIRFITPSNQKIINQIISDISTNPVQYSDFEIRVSAKMDSIVITIKGDSFESGKEKTIQWFRQKGLEDLTKINLIWEDLTQTSN